MYRLKDTKRNGHLDCMKACLAAGAITEVNNLELRVTENDNEDCIALLIKAGAGISYATMKEIVMTGNERLVRLILDADRKPNDEIMLSVAASGGQVNIVDLLIKAGASVNSTREGNALISAARSGSVECVRLLIKAGAYVRQKRASEALFYAVQSGSVECVNMLLEAEADVNFKYTNDSVFYYAVDGEHYDIVDALIKAGAQTDRKTMWRALAKGAERYVSLLRNFGGDLNDVLTQAIRLDRHKTVNILLKAGAQITDKIVEEAHLRSQEIVRIIVEAGGDQNVMLLNAVRNKGPNILDLLFKAGADVNSKIGTEALQFAFQSWYVNGKESLYFAFESSPTRECLRILIEAGADLKTLGRIDLLQALRAKDTEIVRIMLQTGAYLKDPEKTFIFAAGLGALECVKLLIDVGVDVNTTNDDYMSRTALCAAVMKGSAQCTELLINKGADVNTTDRKGRTAVYNAVHFVRLQCLDLLLQAGADKNITDHEGNILLYLSPILFSAKRLKCYKIVLHTSVNVNVANNHGLNTLTDFLKRLEDDQSYAKLKGPTDAKFEEEFAMLLFAAGETVDETKVRKVTEYLKPCADISLKNICREKIRKHLLQINQVNLIYKVALLPLPSLMKSFLLLDVTLDEELSAEHGTD